MPVSLEQFKKLSHWHMPLRGILNDFCGHNRNLLETLEKDKTVYNTLLLYYYKSYFTNASLREKYGLQIKLCPASLRNKMLTIVETNNTKTGEFN